MLAVKGSKGKVGIHFKSQKTHLDPVMGHLNDENIFSVALLITLHIDMLKKQSRYALR